MHEFNIGLLAIAGSALTLGLFSKQLKRLGLPDPVALLLVGVALGPLGAGWLNPYSWGHPMIILEQVARLALAVGLMGVALRLPKNYLLHHWRALSWILGIGMPFMWLCSSSLVAVTLGLSTSAALLIGAVITPTDPVVSSAMVTGPVAEEHLPEPLRHIISAEAGANDGLAYLFVLTAIFLFTLPVEASLGHQIIGIVIGDVLSALLMGGVIGYLAGIALRMAEAKNLIEQPSILMFATALALLTLAVVKLVGSDGILAVFIAGLAFNQQINLQERREEEDVVEGFDRFFTAPVFILLGLMLPWQEWQALGWPALTLIICILFFRRLPLFLLMGRRLRDFPGFLEGAFAGWFGPIGVAAIYYAAMAHDKAQIAELWPVVSLLVTASVFAHGLTASPLSRAYGVCNKWLRQ